MHMAVDAPIEELHYGGRRQVDDLPDKEKLGEQTPA
jgi:hypothetical protein